MNPDYFNPVKIHIGKGSIEKLPGLLGDRTAALVTTQGMVSRGVVDEIQKLCASNLLQVSTEVVTNPTISTMDNCFADLKSCNCDVIIALGGGSAIDTAKGLALLKAHSAAKGWLGDHLRSVKKIPELTTVKPIIAIPTTSGTGSELTKWATVWDEITENKYSISDERLYPEWALLDFELTDSLPYENTLFPALDALSHAMEAIWNKNANPVSDALAIRAIEFSIVILRENFKDKYTQSEVREGLQQASLLAGLAFSNTKTALAHSISYPLTSKLKMPHGLACGFILPEVMQVNYTCNSKRVELIVQALGYSVINDAIESLYEIFENLDIPDILRRFWKSGAVFDFSHFPFIAPDRAENNIASVSQNVAAEMVSSALLRLGVRAL